MSRAPIALALLLLTGCMDYDGNAPTAAPVSEAVPATQPAADATTLPYAREAHPEEKHFRNIRQLTDGGENAEAYFSADGKQLIFQSKRPPPQCDQIYTMNLDGGDLKLVSTGTGRTTCAYWLYPNDDKVLFSSTHATSEMCPPVPDRSMGYVWPIYDSYEIYKANPDGSGLEVLAPSPGYDAEATMSPDGSRICFTSMRDGDLEIYSMAPDGSDVRRLTNTPGYDGGPFYSPDGTKIIFRASRPEGPALEEYQLLLGRGLVRPTKLSIYMMDADGSNLVQLTDNDAGNFCPFFHPDGKRVIFSSNMGDERGREFDLYSVHVDTREIERITWTEDFDGFPMFSPDGRYFVWCSNRHNAQRGETNIFICEWVD
ncbi:MAG: TolB family protein [Planctomycetota bacterium]